MMDLVSGQQHTFDVLKVIARQFDVNRGHGVGMPGGEEGPGIERCVAEDDFLEGVERRGVEQTVAGVDDPS